MSECSGRCYSLTESGAGYVGPECPMHGCTCPPHMDGIGREKWPDCPVHSLPPALSSSGEGGK